MNLEFKQTLRGEFPINNFLKNIDSKASKKILRDMEIMEKYELGQLLRTKTFIKKMAGQGKHKLYEYKTLHNKIQYRILCCIHDGTCYFVHAFIKKDQKTRKSDLKIAISRIQSLNLKL